MREAGQPCRFRLLASWQFAFARQGNTRIENRTGCSNNGFVSAALECRSLAEQNSHNFKFRIQRAVHGGVVTHMGCGRPAEAAPGRIPIQAAMRCPERGNITSGWPVIREETLTLVVIERTFVCSWVGNCLDTCQATAGSRIPLWLVSGWGCRDQHLSTK